MKTILTSFCIFVLIAFLCLALPVSGEERIYEDVIRLHILPASDSREAQDAKILVRDTILAAYGDQLSRSESTEQTELFLKERLGEIEELASLALEEAGMNFAVSVSLAKEEFETRAYGDVTLPRGEYTSLTVRLDEGEGQNWWCVLYPSLCTEVALGESIRIEEEALSEAEKRLITASGFMLRFRTLELLEDIFS